MIYLYRLALPLATIASLPYYLYRMLRRGGYSHKIMHRLGFWPDLKPRKKGVIRIWIQAVSVGEVSSITKLLHDDPFEASTGIYPEPQGVCYVVKPLGEKKFEILGSITPEQW